MNRLNFKSITIFSVGVFLPTTYSIQMSSFVVFSAMGFYPVTPGEPVYSIGSPIFDQVKVDLGNGQMFEIIAHNVSGDNKYIQSASLNGKVLDKPCLNHADLIKGGSLILEMGPKANLKWGIN